MKLSELIKTLQHIQNCYPNRDLEVRHVDTVTDFLKEEMAKPDGFTYVCNDNFFVVEEPGDDGAMEISIRSWPY